MVVEWVRFGKPSSVGLVTGMVAGLATITPAAGAVGPAGALVLGVAAGVLCFAVTRYIKFTLRIDDSLDVFAVHGVGGATGTLLAAFFATSALGGAGLAEGVSVGSQFGVQVAGVVAAAVWSAVASYVLVKLTQAVCGLRASRENMLEGLDFAAHGEKGYNI
jgi:Amt family ammonium transporter